MPKTLDKDRQDALRKFTIPMRGVCLGKENYSRSIFNDITDQLTKWNDKARKTPPYSPMEKDLKLLSAKIGQAVQMEAALFRDEDADEAKQVYKSIFNVLLLEMRQWPGKQDIKRWKLTVLKEILRYSPCDTAIGCNQLAKAPKKAKKNKTLCPNIEYPDGEPCEAYARLFGDSLMTAATQALRETLREDPPMLEPVVRQLPEDLRFLFLYGIASGIIDSPQGEQDSFLAQLHTQLDSSAGCAPVSARKITQTLRGSWLSACEMAVYLSIVFPVLKQPDARKLGNTLDAMTYT